jgi:hypothetical protein
VTEKAIIIAFVASLAAASWAVEAPKFVPIDPAILEGHPPLFISWESVKREGSKRFFDLPVGNAGWFEQYRHND